MKIETSTFKKKSVCEYCVKVKHTVEVFYKRQQEQEQWNHQSNKANKEEVDSMDLVLMGFKNKSRLRFN